MPVWAMGFGEIELADVAAASVLARGDGFQMEWVHAVAMLAATCANMVDLMAIGDGADE